MWRSPGFDELGECEGEGSGGIWVYVWNWLALSKFGSSFSSICLVSSFPKSSSRTRARFYVYREDFWVMGVNLEIGKCGRSY